MEPIDNNKKELEKQCGPSCECNTPTPRSKAKIAVAILVLAAAVAVFVVKFVGKDADPAFDQGPSANQPKAAAVVSLDAKPLGSLLELNTSAAALDAVLVIVPAKDGGAVEQKIIQEVDATRQKLVAKVMTVGVYTLRTDTPDYGALAGKNELPGVIVFAGGGDKAMVSADNLDSGLVTGTITESKLLQAYVAASMGASGGGCNCAKGASCGGN